MWHVFDTEPPPHVSVFTPIWEVCLHTPIINLGISRVSVAERFRVSMDTRR